MARQPIRVLGCGNPDAGDDAAGLAAVRLARERLARFPGVEVVEVGPAVRVLDHLEGTDAAVVVDAVRPTGASRQPGRILRARIGPTGLEADLGSFLSSHGIGLAEVVGLAAVLGRVARLSFLGVEVERTVSGTPLSEPVAEALPSLVDAIVQEVSDLAEEEAS